MIALNGAVWGMLMRFPFQEPLNLWEVTIVLTNRDEMDRCSKDKRDFDSLELNYILGIVWAIWISSKNYIISFEKKKLEGDACCVR